MFNRPAHRLHRLRRRPGGAQQRRHARQDLSTCKAAKRPVILVHGLLLSQKMHRPLAEDLAARGNRVITVDLLGHGESDRPRDMWRYSMHPSASSSWHLMDHLEIPEAVVMGTSLGANASLRDRRDRARAAARDDRRDAGTGQWAAGLRASRSRRSSWRSRFGEPMMKLVASVAGRCRDGCCPTTATCCSTLCARTLVPAARCCRACSSVVSRRTAMNDARSRRPRWCSATVATRFIPSQTRGCWPRSLPDARLIEADSLVELRLRPSV